ncbi:MAG: HAD-IB family hydrolase [Acidimicrobiia bacterium]|nr:HAD-IB family hydrolase [Acidimicrobiia bacterium]
MDAAFFDLDKTIIAKSSTLAFRRHMYKAGLLNRRTLLRMAVAQFFYVLFGADHSQMERVREALMALIKGWDSRQLKEIVAETLEDVVAPLVYAEALFLIDEHHREGRKVIIVSSSPTEIVEPLAHYLGVDDVIATRAGVDERGLYTGELEFYAYGPTKAEALQELAANGLDLSASYAYSDSHTDLPLLEAVGNPVAVNPDRELRKVAEERDWPIREFDLAVDLRTRLADIPKPDPVISGAAVATAIAAVLAVVLLRSRRKT